jgi:hypothetical protein
LLNAVTTVFIDGYPNVGKLLLHLVWLIANVVGSAMLIGKQIAFGVSLVSTAQGGYVQALALQQAYQVFGVWCFACASYGKVSHTYNRYVETL